MVHQHIEDGGEFFLPVDGLDTAGRSGFFFGVFVPFPDGNMLIGLQEQCLPVNGVGAVRVDQQDAVFRSMPLR